MRGAARNHQLKPWLPEKQPRGVSVFTCTPVLSCWMRWVISDSFSLDAVDEVVVSGRDEMSSAR